MEQSDAMTLNGKSAIVTGGTTGIGRAIAKSLAREGVNVLIFGRHEAELSDALEVLKFAKSKVIGLTADVSLEQDVAKVFSRADDEFEALDILINNAGLGGDDLQESEWNDWKYVLDTNLLGYLGCARAAIDRMKKRKAGHIVNIGSISAEKKGAGGEIYVASKSAIRGMSASLAKGVSKEGIRVTLIEPGKVGSDMIEANPAKQRKLISEDKMMKAEDIAECVVFCLTRPQRCAIQMMQMSEFLSEEC